MLESVNEGFPCVLQSLKLLNNLLVPSKLARVVAGRGVRQTPVSHLRKLLTEGLGCLERLPVGWPVD
jgi:hypothetical protein